MSSTTTTVERGSGRQMLTDAISEGAGRVRGSVRAGTAHVQAGSRKVARAADGFVHDRPWSAVGLAAVAGLVAGVISMRR